MHAQSITRSPDDATEFELGYCIGLIVGEGSFCRGGATRDKKREIRLRVCLHSNDPAPIQTLHRVMGGRINGPYTYNRPGRATPHCVLHWTLSGPCLRRWVPTLLERMPPSRKRQQMLARFGLPPETTTLEPEPPPQLSLPW